MNIREQYEKKTGLKAIEHVTDGIHSIPVIEIFAFEYVNWMEQQLTWKSIDELPTKDGYYSTVFEGELIPEINYLHEGVWQFKNSEVTHWIDISKCFSIKFRK